MVSIDQQVIPIARIIAKLLNSIALVQKLHWFGTISLKLALG